MMRILGVILLLTGCCCFAQQFPYKDRTIPLDRRVADLIQRMSVAEQAAQLRGIFSTDTLAFDSAGTFVGMQDSSLLAHGIGSYMSLSIRRTSTPQYWARCLNSLQKYMLEKTRLGIPVFIFSEGLHGIMAEGATSFPQAIALGCTWDTALVEQIFSTAAFEARTSGIHQVLSPVVDLARDPRWGRTEECYSEDPYLVSRMGMAAVFGFQGRGEAIGEKHVAVILKHFAGHGQAEGGRNIAPIDVPEREFRENHLYPFEMAVIRAHARSIMASYNEWDGIPNHVNKKLLTDILRGEWGFDGCVMSDGGGMDVTYHEHHAAADSIESGILSLNAGIDYELGRGSCFGDLVAQATKGKVTEEAIRRAAARVLKVKFESGLFDKPYADIDLMEKTVNSVEHRALALKAAHEAMVLLKNDKSILPFHQNKIKTLAVIGPNAAGIHLGGYSAVPMKGISVLEGLREFAEGKFRIRYAEGCKLTMNPECNWLAAGNPVLADPRTDKKLIAEAVRIAKQSDAVVLVLGENELICREGWSEEHLGDRDNLDLVGRQNELAEAILNLGKPVVVLLVNGRPISINALAKNAPAIIECWYLGQETGRAVADVLFGKVNPSGKLTVTFPRSVGQIPCYYDKKPSRHRSYVLSDSSPLFPFGFGLSYSNFVYSNLTLSTNDVTAGGTLHVSVDVHNRGAIGGDEVVQLYLHKIVSLPTRPVQELKDFARVTLPPGETRNVSFTLTQEKFSTVGIDMKRSVDAGMYEIMVGTNSVEVLRDTVIVR